MGIVRYGTVVDSDGNHLLSQGRNGYVKTKGAVVQSLGDRVRVGALSGRDEMANGYVTVPFDEVPNVVGELARMFLEAHPTRLQELEAAIDEARRMSLPLAEEDADALDGIGMRP